MKKAMKGLLVLAALGSVSVLAACNQPTAQNNPGETATEQVTEAPASTETPVTESPATSAAADGTTDTSATPASSEQAQTIVEIASGDSTFSTLVTALKAAELTEVLSGEGPYTVFAPTDEAFAALPEGTVENLLKPENKDQLIKILKYHVVPAKVMAADVQAGTVESVEGTPLEIQVDETTKAVKVNDATVIKTDIVGSNGVIHAVDAVILPPENQ
ncbi:MAG: fasciclin domain-containing protein [Microcoleaceae cyanobacterium]